MVNTDVPAGVGAPPLDTTSKLLCSHKGRSSLVTSPRVPPSEKWSGERSRITWFTRPFFFVRGWGLGTRLRKILHLLVDDLTAFDEVLHGVG